MDVGGLNNDRKISIVVQLSDPSEYDGGELELFGPSRLMYGSDWPVCLIAGEYEKFLEVLEKFTDSLSSSEKDRIMGETAAEFYRIG